MESVKKYEPHLALFAEEGGLYFYKKILVEIENNLKEKYIVAFEIGENQGNELIALAKSHFPTSEIILEKDLQERDRFLFITNRN